MRRRSGGPINNVLTQKEIQTSADTSADRAAAPSAVGTRASPPVPWRGWTIYRQIDLLDKNSDRQQQAKQQMEGGGSTKRAMEDIPVSPTTHPGCNANGQRQGEPG